MNKHIIPILVILLLLSSGFVGVSNQTEETTVDKEMIDEDYAFYFDEHHFPELYSSEKHMLGEHADDATSTVLPDPKEITRPSLIETKKKEVTQTSTSGGPMDSPWPMKGHDIRHTGRSPYGTADNPGFEIWLFKTKDEADCSPVIDNDGTIYIGSTEFYAVYPNGTLKWKYDFAGRVEVSAPAIDENGILYVGTVNSMPNYLYAFDTTNKSLKLKYKAGNDIESSPAIGDDGTIYFGDWSGNIHAVNPNGTRKWKYTTGDVVTSSPAIGGDGTVYCGSHDDYVYAFYPNNGTVKWKFKTGSWVHGSPTIGDDGTIYIGSDNGYLYALYPNNGSMKWRCSIGATWASPALDENGTLYIGVWEEKFYAIFPNGTIKWTFDPGHRIWGSSAAISADETIYFGTSDISGTSPWEFDIIALNPDGTEKWRKYIETIFSSPAIGEDGTVYIGSEDGLRAFGRGEVKADADGPHFGLINEPVQFNGSATCGYPPYSWSWDFDDDGIEDSTDQNPSYNYTSSSNYTVTLTVTDDSGNTSDDTTWAWIQETNDPPDKPSIDGPTSGKVGTFYDYTAQTTDHDDNDIWYFLYWGDGSGTGWLGPFDSGEDVTKHHRWTEKGTYNITCKAKDVYGEESDFGTLEVTMPKNLQSSNSLFIRFLEGHPRMFPILRYLLGP